MKLTPLDVSGIKRDKLSLIINTLLSSGGITRGELASRCGVSAMTAGKVVSAMLEAGYATVSKDYDRDGRYLDHIYPSDVFRFLMIEMSEDSMSATVYDALYNTRLSYTQPRNESIPRELDEAAFISMAQESASAIKGSSALLGAVICSDKEPLSSAMGLPLFSRRLAAAEYVSRAYPKGCVMLVGAETRGDLTLISDGAIVSGKYAPIGAAKEINSELELLEYLVERLSTFFSFITPDKIIIDTSGLSVTRRFASALSERLCERHSTEKEKLPEIVTSDGISPSCHAVIGQLILEYSKSLSRL